MLNPASLAIDALTGQLRRAYVTTFGRVNMELCDRLATIARTALERIADTDALYHDIEHTIMVTLVGQEILRGKKIRCGGVTPEDWLHFTTALLCHDIGYVRGICVDDTAPSFVASATGNTTELARGASDAALTAYHVDRGKIFVAERFSQFEEIDVARVQAAIELTRFPVPDDGDHDETNTEPGLVRAADLIGQLADPHYFRKINALYQEFRETGMADKLGYESSADLAEGYPKFYWQAVRPYISDALAYLRLTQSGKQWIANLYGHIFAVEHEEFHLGPEQPKKGES